MNEYQRQAYLTALGIENYMPRWLLTNAPESKICVLPKFIESEEAVNAVSRQVASVISVFETAIPATVEPVVFADVLRDLTSAKKTQVIPVPERMSDATVKPTTHKSIAAFALSIWRPQADFLILDTRNTLLALPTEVLLKNIICALCKAPTAIGNEEILRWPMMSNSTISRTIDDARSVLQVWLEIELERRPVKHLLLMGQDAAEHFLPINSEYNSVLFAEIELDVVAATAIIAPSLVELLQQPLLKQKLWQALKPWYQLT